MKYLILENIRSAHNVGAMFRTADGAGVDKIFLIGYTPTPIDRFGRPQPEITKTSLGACDEILWEHAVDLVDLIWKLKDEGVTVVSVEQGSGVMSLRDFDVPEKVAYIMGNEVTGVSAYALAESDHMVDLPMLGTKESLNVATTAGIVMYHDLLQK